MTKHIRKTIGSGTCLLRSSILLASSSFCLCLRLRIQKNTPEEVVATCFLCATTRISPNHITNPVVEIGGPLCSVVQRRLWYSWYISRLNRRTTSRCLLSSFVVDASVAVLDSALAQYTKKWVDTIHDKRLKIANNNICAPLSSTQIRAFSFGHWQARHHGGLESTFVARKT